MTFNKLGLSEPILKGLEQLGFEKPTPVQEKTIPLLLKEKVDLVALAQTGTGKTAAYGIPIIESIDLENKSTQALVLSPTRELCIQIAQDFKKFARFYDGLRIQAVYGGTDITKQIRGLNKGVHIIVATPGRMLDLMNRGNANITSISTVVLDEADEMLNMGFQEDLNDILADTPSDKNTLLFSATMPREAEQISKEYMDDPVKITVGKRNSGAENVEHLYYVVHAKDRYHALKRVVDNNPDIYGIIFCRTRMETKDIAEKLIHDGYNADALHGDLTQAQRDFVMNKFRNKNLQMLIATDVAARGLDVNDLTHVINLDFPDDIEVYTHRSGRTGRAGNSGVSISIINGRERGKLQRIERKINKKFQHKQVPLGRDVCATQLMHLIDKIKSVEVDHAQIEPFLAQVNEKLDGLSRDDLIKHFVSLEFNRFLDYYKNAKDIHTVDMNRFSSESRDRGRTRGKRGGRDGATFTRFFIDIGSKDKLDTGSLIGFINRMCRNRDMRIGKIEVLKSFSFFEVENSYSELIMNSFRGAKFDQRSVNVELAQSNDREKRRAQSNDRDKRRVQGGNYRDKRKRRIKHP